MRRKKLDTTIQIREVEFCHDDHEAFGDADYQNNIYTIRIAKNRNNKPYILAGTLLHELIHHWCAILQRTGYLPAGMKNEHKLINAIEAFAMYWLTYVYLDCPKTMPKKLKMRKK